MNKIIINFFIFIFLINTVYSFAVGNGSQNTPYQITSCADLSEINNALDSHYILMGNVNCSMTQSLNDGKGFEPIGNFSDSSSYVTAFRGDLNGNGFMIENIYINRSEQNYVGLFAQTYNSKIYNLSFSGTVYGNGYTGGLIGMSRDSEYYNLINHINVISSGIFYTGGIFGYTRTDYLYNITNI